MRVLRRSGLYCLAIGCVIAFSSCWSGPSRVEMPGIDASSAGEGAMQQYDANSDGKVAGEELEKAPALKAALPRLDQDGDNAVSAEEVAARVAAWQEVGTGLTSVRCNVSLDGRPLADAKVVFEPEAFLGDEIKPASGITNQFGDLSPTIADEDKPDPSLPGGVHFGLYKVRISKQVNGRETIPARYNTETTIGQEVSYDDPAMKSGNMSFDLKGSS